VDGVDALRSILQDLRIAISLCTRLPLALAAPVADGEIARASWALPVAGMLVGLIGAAIYWVAEGVHMPPQAASVLALAATVLVTGAMHEDGLADTADGLGGGKTREEKLEIMRDSRIGTFGACALAISLLLRWIAITTFDDPRSVAIALVAAHSAARAALPTFMRLVPPARREGLSSGAGQPPGQSVAISLALGGLALAGGLGAGAALACALSLSAIAFLFARLALEQIGGQTGDVLGAMEQTSEAAVLLIAAAHATL
jgi:adenosylcobinamide-GDP ribazoletransferase